MKTNASRWVRTVAPVVLPPAGECVTDDRDCFHAAPLEMIRRGETARRLGGWDLAIEVLSGRGHYSWACAMTAQHGPTGLHPSRADVRGRPLDEIGRAPQRDAARRFRDSLGQDFGWQAWHAFFDVCEAAS